MKRKQVYLTEQLDQKLAELAEARGVPQSELIREGLEMYLLSVESSEAEWSELIRSMKQTSYRDLSWNRQQLYEDRRGRE